MNKKIRLTKQFEFEMAHTLTGYDGSCREIHGHSYKLFVTVAGCPDQNPDNPKFGMTLDFGILKRLVNEHIIDRYDHSLVIRATGHNHTLIDVLRGDFSKVQVVDYQPTCENMVMRFAESIMKELPEGVELIMVRLCETATSYAEWWACDN